MVAAFNHALARRAGSHLTEQVSPRPGCGVRSLTVICLRSIASTLEEIAWWGNLFGRRRHAIPVRAGPQRSRSRERSRSACWAPRVEPCSAVSRTEPDHADIAASVQFYERPGFSQLTTGDTDASLRGSATDGSASGRPARLRACQLRAAELVRHVMNCGLRVSSRITRARATATSTS